MCCARQQQPSVLRQQYSNAHVKHHADDVVGDGDKGTGGNGRVYLQLLQRHGHQGTEYGGKHHHCKQADGNGVSHRCRRAKADEVIDVDQERDDSGVDGIGLVTGAYGE